MIALIRAYQRQVSSRTPSLCRYEPSCSCYAIDALEAHGAVRGLLMAFWRVLRCNPFSPGGHDPVRER